MKTGLLLVLLTFVTITSTAQQTNNMSPFNGAYWGVVLEVPAMKNVSVRSDIVYASEPGQRPLKMDIYLPADIQPTARRPTVVLLNGLGDQPDLPPLKTNPSYTSWARLIAANGFVAVTMDSEVNHVQESFKSFFRYVSVHGAEHYIDTARMGAQSFSANGREACQYLMSQEAFEGIKAAAVYYGERPPGPYRKDLPMLFIVSELDIRNENYSSLWTEVLRTNAPWTITLARDMPHAFDVFSDTETSRRLIMQTISFWRDQLAEIPKLSIRPSKERAIVAARYERDQSKMLRLMREWMSENPNTRDAYALSAYGTVLMENREYTEAEKYLKRAIAIEPKNKGNYLTLAVVLFALDRSDEGKKALAHYEEGRTPEAFTYAYIGTRMVALGRYAFAAELFERSISLPNPAGYMYYYLGCCYARLDQHDRAFNNLFSAASLGFGNRASYEKEEHLKSLQSYPRWKELMTKLR